MFDILCRKSESVPHTFEAFCTVHGVLYSTHRHEVHSDCCFQVINEDCNGLLEKAQKGDYSTGMPRQGEVHSKVLILQRFFST